MGQPEFFDLSRRYEGLDGKNDPLARLATLIPWEMFRPQLLTVPTAQNLRTPPDGLSFMRFLGLGLEDAVRTPPRCGCSARRWRAPARCMPCLPRSTAI